MRNPIYSNGKLLLTGEYAVLDGALSLAVPTKFGQSLSVEAIDVPQIIWKSLDENDAIWFETDISVEHINSNTVTNHEYTDRLIQILGAAKKLNPDFLSDGRGYNVSTKLDFPRHWGLGTSSTLINNIAQWANIDAYKLLELTFGGSGYDIACAQHDSSILYQLEHNKPFVKLVDFNPVFIDHLYFVYLNKKQNSRDGIRHYNANKTNLKSVLEDINKITSEVINTANLEHFETLIDKHETIISKLTRQAPVKTRLFSDFKGSIKSLGAWGGDFVLATTKNNPITYFKDKGFETVIRYSDMVL